MAEKKEAKKVFKFVSQIDFLYVGDLGVQFIDGKYETDNEKVAERLVSYEDVEEA